ncbi:hypothetical protein OAS78_14385 [Pseudomonadales bacterium]|jgi:hypothetical protein|nr:hypothetical protein [Pseudomonadales bacterium]
MQTVSPTNNFARFVKSISRLLQPHQPQSAVYYNFSVFVFAASTFSCLGCFTWDIDGNSSVTALSDGLLVLRYLFGFEGDALIADTLTETSTRTSSTEIQTHIQEQASHLDIDGDGQNSPLTDGLLLLRYLFELRNDALTSGAVSAGATRNTAAEIEACIDARIPPAT